jgi:hypothetical protein
MTQIVSLLFRELCVLQVVDRLLTTKDGKPFDDLTNKSIIYWAKDAIVCMSYTGPAFIGKLPTDSWIAWKLCGDSPSLLLKQTVESGGVLLGNIPLMNIWQAMNLLESELRKSEIARQSLDFELVVVGWKWKRGNRALEGRRRPLPFAWSIRKYRGEKLAIHHLDHNWPLDYNTLWINLPIENMSNADLQELTDKVRRIPVNPQVPSDDSLRGYEEAIVDGIRAVSAKNPYVGSNCMSILIAPPHRRAFMRIRFFPDRHYPARDFGIKSVPPEYAAAFSPWIIGRNFVQSPQVFYGGSSGIRMGPFEIFLEGFPGGGFRKGSSFGTATHPRRSRPT